MAQKGFSSTKWGELPKDQKIKKKCSPTWAMLIKMVYEVDPAIEKRNLMR